MSGRPDSLTSSNLLRGDRVRLTALTKDDLPAIARWYEDTAFGRLFDAEPATPRSAAELEKWLEEQRKAGNGYLFAIRPLDGDDLLGYIEMDGILWAHQTGWLGIGIGEPDNWGRGYGYEALRLALDFAFHELNLYRVQLTVFEYNERAIALYEKLGFRREGVFREFVHRDGRRYDMLLYGLLRREWEGRGGN
jgi:RimJ/RimL family protein N-acetyltransferase